jgi:3-dehydroquinate dehydratase-1
MRRPPDLFELRLDALRPRWHRHPADEAWAGSPCHGKLHAPLIVTARHPREGGANQLSLRERRGLLLAFLPQAAYVDVELRSARACASVLRAAKAKNIRTILSFHDFSGTPSAADLNEVARAANSLGADVLKIATRTDTPEQLARLQQFFSLHRRTMKISAMGMGRLGRAARLWCAQRGSVLNYAHLGTARIDGQLSVAQWRRALK